MRVAILGTRGIPAAYSGFETLAEQLSARLARRGHEVTVYCRPGRTGNGRRPEGVRLVALPCIRNKYMETLSHTALTAVHALGQRYDVVLMCNAANASVAWIPRIGRTPVVLNVDGLDRKREKWNRFGQLYYALSERLATVTATRIVTDARVIQRYYQERYGADTTYIPYGFAEPPDPAAPPAPDGPIRRFGLVPGKYVLYVSRLEPENHAHTVVSAFASSPELPLTLVVTGHAPYAASYIRKVLAVADSRTIFTGGVYGDGYHELQAHAAMYVQATAVGGVHPALVEAMGHGKAIICADTSEQRETLGDGGLYFRPGDSDGCARAMRALWADPELRQNLGHKARQRARDEYSWDDIMSAYERLFSAVGSGRRRSPRR